jgi:uncharacterized protein
MIQISGFKPAWWLSNAHAQTVYPFFRKRPNKLRLIWERMSLPDNDFIDLVWTEESGGPIILVLHGLEGSIESHYAEGIMAALHNRGWRVVLMHFRGCSGTHNTMARGYHSGETGDLRFLIKTIHTRYPDRKYAAVGFSLGGNVLLKYLGEYGADCRLDSAVAVSVPFLLNNAADRLNNGFSKIYQRHLIRKIQGRIIDKFKSRADAPFSVADIPKWNNFHLFDNFVTAPLHGFSSSTEYYRLCSSRQFIKGITVPVLIIHSKDDPFITIDAIPDAAEIPDNVTLELSRKGGHVGFINGSLPWRSHYWLESRIPEYLANILDDKN